MVMLLDLRQYVALTFKWLWLLIAAPLLSASIYYMMIKDNAPTFVASTSLMAGEMSVNSKPNLGDFQVAQQAATIYSDMLQRQPVLEATVKALDLPFSWKDLRDVIVVIQPAGSPVFEIRVYDTSPVRARDIAAGLAQQLILASPTASADRDMESRRAFVQSELASLQNRIDGANAELEKSRAKLAQQSSARGAIEVEDEVRGLEVKLDAWRTQYASLLLTLNGQTGQNRLKVIEPAVVPTITAGPRKLWFVALAAVAGLAVAVVGIIAIELLDNTVRERADLEKLFEAPTLGLLHRRRISRKRRFQPVDSETLEGETFRGLATLVRASVLDKKNPTLLLTSASEGEGKTTTAVNLAVAMAQSGKQVVLVDLDLRNPSLHHYFGAANDRGVSTLSQQPTTPTERFVRQTRINNLRLLTGGPPLQNPTASVEEFMEQRLAELAKTADYVIMDSPPLLAVADTAVAAARVDGVMFLAYAGRTRRPECKKSSELLSQVSANLVGVILNGVPKSAVVLRGYHYRSPQGGAPTASQPSPPTQQGRIGALAPAFSGDRITSVPPGGRGAAEDSAR